MRFVLLDDVIHQSLSLKLQGEPDRPFLHDVNAAPAKRQAANLCSSIARLSGGARRDRTDVVMLAKHALYQLSYGP